MLANHSTSGGTSASAVNSAFVKSRSPLDCGTGGFVSDTDRLPFDYDKIGYRNQAKSSTVGALGTTCLVVVNRRNGKMTP
jgi:hypothetical protein